MRNMAIFVLALLVAGCSFRPDMIDVNTTFEARYETSEINDKWWQEFGDERLNFYVEKALENNIDLRLAVINLEQARLSLGNAKADLFPSVSVEGSASKTRTSGETFGAQSRAKYDSFGLNAVLNYELDLWGRVRNSVRSNEALLNASKFDFASARLGIASGVAKSYFALVSLKMQEAVYEDTLKSYKDTMAYRKRQLDAGVITNMVYMQSVAQVQSAQISLQNIKTSIASASNALAILCNFTNDEILSGFVDTAVSLPKAPQIDAGISSDALLRRPDVASAYESLKSSNALVGVARAAYFPKLSLTGLFGFGSDELDRLFVSNANTWSLGASLAQSVFDYGKRSNNVEIAKLTQSANALKYENAVKSALGEVRVALLTRENAVNIDEQSEILLGTQKKIYELANAQYDAGYVDHLTLLDAERSLLSTRLSRINAQLELDNAVIEVYRALGGGFKVDSLQND